MKSFFAILLLLLSFVVSTACGQSHEAQTSSAIAQISNRIVESEKNQIRQYVSRLSESDAGLYYWGLLSIYNDSEYGKNSIQKEYGQSNNIYLYSLTHFSHDEKRFRFLYKKKHNVDYLILALYLSGDKKGLRILSNKQNKYRDAVIDILLNKKVTYIPSHQLSILDIYLNTNLFNYSSNGVSVISNTNHFKNAIINVLKLGYLDSKNKFNEVIQTYRTTDLKSIPQSKIKIKTWQLVSYAYYTKGFYYDSIELYRNKIIPHVIFINDEFLKQKSYANYGSFFYYIGDIINGQKYLNKAYEIAKKESDYTNFDIIVNNLAITYLKMGELNKAISLQYEAYTYALKSDNKKTSSSIVNNLPYYYMKIDDWNNAFIYLKKSYNLSIKSGSVENSILSQLGLSKYYWKHLENFTKSDSLIRTALKEAKKNDLYKYTIMALSDESSLLKDFNKIRQAISIRDSISVLSKNKKDWKIWTENQLGTAYLLTKINQFVPADSILNHISAHQQTFLEFQDIVDKTIAESRILDHKQKFSAAIDKLSKLKGEIFERVKNSLDRQSGHLMLTGDELESIHLLTDLYLKKGENDRAIALQDQVKTLNKAAYLNSSVLKSSVFNDKELIQDRLLTKKIEQYRSQLATADSNQIVSIQNKLTDAIAQKNDLENQITKNLNKKPISVNDIQDRLTNQDAVLYYTQFHNTIYCSLITNNRVQIHKISLPDSVKSVFEDAAHSLQGNHANLVGLHHIYHTLFDSMNVDSYKRLYVVPDGILYQIPFDILPTTQPANRFSYGSTHYLIEKHSISYYTSLQELYHSWKPSHDSFKYEYAGFGINKFNNRYSSLASNKVLGALPNTVKEVEAIDSLLPGSQKKKLVFIDNAATESAFKRIAPETRILHLATHSEVFFNEPLFSVIYMHKKVFQNASLSDDPTQDDGQIHAYELFPLHLKSDMVMLSSCESGTGSYITGSGLIGLNRAFTYAGVKSLVMNMWKVDDKAAETVSVQFYKYLKQGLPKDEALRKAKLYYLNNIDSDPLKWGSYIVTGNISPLFHPIWNLTTIATRFLILLIAIVAGYVTYRFNKS